MREEVDESDQASRNELIRDAASMHRSTDHARANFPVENTPPVYNPIFFNRETELHDMKTQIRPNDHSKSTPILVLGGAPGIGKSTLALKLFRELSQEKTFDAIFWINAESRDTIVVSFAGISGWIEHPKRITEPPDPEQNSMLALAWLRTTSMFAQISLSQTNLVTGKTWMLIYDNLEDKDLFAQYNPGGQGAIVVTTRSSVLGSQLGGEDIGVAKLSKTYSVIAFKHFRSSRGSRKFEQDETREIDELLELLDGLALGIKQIASYIGAEELTVGEYLARYKSMPKILLSDQSESKHLAQAWDVEFADFRTTKDRKRIHACQLLSILSLISAHEIQMNLFALTEKDEGPEEIFDVFVEMEGVE